MTLKKGNTESNFPRACGSQKEARTPEGIFDLTGNVAEWVKDTQRRLDDPKQITIGGHYGSGKIKSLNRSYRQQQAKMSHMQVGFRAAKRWARISRDD